MAKYLKKATALMTTIVVLSVVPVALLGMASEMNQWPLPTPDQSKQPTEAMDETRKTSNTMEEPAVTDAEPVILFDSLIIHCISSCRIMLIAFGD